MMNNNDQYRNTSVANESEIINFGSMNKKLKRARVAAWACAFVALLCACYLYIDGNDKSTKNITFSQAEGVELIIGEEKELPVMFYPGNAENTEYALASSDESVVSVSGHSVKGENSGTALVSIYQGGKQYGQCLVKVNHIEPTSIHAATNELESLIIGEISRPFELPVAYLPNNATDKELIGYVADPELAEFKDGKVTGLQEGVTTITVIHKTTGLSLNFDVKFIPVDAESITITLPKTVSIGDEIELKVRTTPEDATYENIKWSSDSSCVKISEGKLLAVKEGKATITAKHSSGLKDSLEIEVIPVPVESIEIGEFKTTIYTGDTEKIEVSFTPENATHKDVKYYSADESIATVSEKGVVTGKKAGKTEITVESSNGMTDSVKVTIEPKPLPIKNSWVVKPSGSCPCPITINTPADHAVYIFFKEVSDSSKDFGLLVEADSSYRVTAPIGTYDVYYASGNTWYGKEYRFGKGTTYKKCETICENYYLDGKYWGHIFTLEALVDGNMHTEPIPESEFPG